MGFQTCEETSRVPAGFPRGWLHISQLFFSNRRWTERCKKRKYWLGMPVALKELPIFHSLELSGTVGEIQVWCQSKAVSSATHKWEERVWRRQQSPCKLVIPLEGPVLEDAPVTFPCLKTQTKKRCPVPPLVLVFLWLLKRRGMFQKGELVSAKSLFSQCWQGALTHTVEGKCFSPPNRKAPKEKCLPRCSPVLVELCPRDIDKRNFPHSISGLAALSSRCPAKENSRSFINKSV